MAEAVFLTVEQVQAQALQLVAISKVQHVGGRDTTMGEVGQQGIGVGKQAQLLEALKQLPGQCLRQHGGRFGPGRLVAEQGVESFLDLIVHSSDSWFRRRVSRRSLYRASQELSIDPLLFN
ncbi:hypothetical protein D3C87_1500720 [compost metagenome]